MTPKYFFTDLLKMDKLPEDVNSFVIEAVKKDPIVDKDLAIKTIISIQNGKQFTDNSDSVVPDKHGNIIPYMKIEAHRGVIKMFKFRKDIDLSKYCYHYCKFKNDLVAFGGKNIKTKILNKGK